MNKLGVIATLLLAAAPAAAQSQAPTTGVICSEEMTATFCNVPTSPNTNGYQSSGGSGSGSGTASNTPSISPSIPPCAAEPPADELCN
jgi:hypothetical protein